MKLRFFWGIMFDILYPMCESDTINDYDVSPLSCLLTDDGGQRPIDTILWLEEGLRRIKSAADAGEELYWSRESWGVKLSDSIAIIYSLHDEDCSETIDVQFFETVVCEWINFIQAAPKAGVSKSLVS